MNEPLRAKYLFQELKVHNSTVPVPFFIIISTHNYLFYYTPKFVHLILYLHEKIVDKKISKTTNTSKNLDENPWTLS